MNDRDFKKWRPFNSVVPSKDLLEKCTKVEAPLFSSDQLEEFEEKLKKAYYLKEKITIVYLDRGQINETQGHIVKLNSVSKNIYLNTKVINFRQIIDIKKEKE